MSYVDALFDRDTDKISVVERIEGERRYVEYPARYVAYLDAWRKTISTKMLQNYKLHFLT